MGPLRGYKIVEFAGAGPGPFCGMNLSDNGATIVRIERIEEVELGVPRAPQYDVMRRGRHILKLDLKNSSDVELALSLIDAAHVVTEGFRPGVMERLGLGPDICLGRNPRLVYARLTGWGQTGPLANIPGHDLNYIALSGALHAIGRAGERPVPPLSLIGDFAGGGLMATIGILCALLEAQKSGKGQVVDIAMSDGAAYLMSVFYGLFASGGYMLDRGTNIVDGGVPYYDTYLCADGKYVSVAPIEKRFREKLYELIGLEVDKGVEENDPKHREMLASHLAEIFRARTRQQWCDKLEKSDGCFAPVLSMEEAPTHPQYRARNSFFEIDGVVQPAPAIRYSSTKTSYPQRAADIVNVEEFLVRWSARDCDL